ncbi:MAG: hypothetical protein J3Q66DRAFT_338732 [Benniella sp.]|nr:MAG: hypothetical protein J3Q66DRAFT_338732 [Benniella sp.]
MFNISSPLRSNSSPQKDLELVRTLLESARKTDDPQLALTICRNAKATLSRMRRTAKNILLNPTSHENYSLRKGTAAAYTDLGELLATLGYQNKAQKCYKKAEDLGGHAQLTFQSTSSNLCTSPRFSLHKPSGDIAKLPPDIFIGNRRLYVTIFEPPKPDKPLYDTPQLAYYLGVLKNWQSAPEDITDLAARKWLYDIDKNIDEKERFTVLAMDLVEAFRRDEQKDAKAIAEIVYLAPVLEKDDYRYLFNQLYDGFDRSNLLHVHHLEGLTQVIHSAVSDYLIAGDLVRILEILSARLKEVPDQAPHSMYQLTLAVSHVLDAMADTGLQELDRGKLYKPFSVYLDKLQDNPDPYLVFQSAYSFQALQYVLGNDCPWQMTTLQSLLEPDGTKMALDVDAFIDELKNIQRGVAAAPDILQLDRNVYKGASALEKSGKRFQTCITEYGCLEPKQPWYSALRGADTLIRDGRLVEFKRLVCEAPCRRDPAFQWGLCQRLGSLAADSKCDAATRQNAIAFLKEIYLNDAVWGQFVDVKQWIVNILRQLKTLPGHATQAAEAALIQLGNGKDVDKHYLYYACLRDGPFPYPLRPSLPALTSPSLLDRVQSVPGIEASLHQLRRRRLKEYGNVTCTQLNAKANLQAPDDSQFPLMDKMKEFMESEQTVFLLIGHSRVGTTKFGQVLECDIWRVFGKRDGIIPLYINLLSIEQPEHDLIAKHLKMLEFRDSQIKELKSQRRFILICDGYDESRQTHNLYMTNQLNQTGEWSAKMVISCSTEYIGNDYLDCFLPMDKNCQPQPEFFQQAVITP